MLQAYGFSKPLNGKGDIDRFETGLNILANSSICSGCKAEITSEIDKDRYDIRQCRHGRGYNWCLECAEFLCKKLAENPGVIKFGCLNNLAVVKQKGIEKWIDGR